MAGPGGVRFGDSPDLALARAQAVVAASRRARRSGTGARAPRGRVRRLGGRDPSAAGDGRARRALVFRLSRHGGVLLRLLALPDRRARDFHAAAGLRPDVGFCASSGRLFPVSRLSRRMAARPHRHDIPGLHGLFPHLCGRGHVPDSGKRLEVEKAESPPLPFAVARCL